MALSSAPADLPGFSLDGSFKLTFFYDGDELLPILHLDPHTTIGAFAFRLTMIVDVVTQLACNDPTLSLHTIKFWEKAKENLREDLTMSDADPKVLEIVRQMNMASAQADIGLPSPSSTHNNDDDTDTDESTEDDETDDDDEIHMSPAMRKLQRAKPATIREAEQYVNKLDVSEEDRNMIKKHCVAILRVQKKAHERDHEKAHARGYRQGDKLARRILNQQMQDVLDMNRENLGRAKELEAAIKKEKAKVAAITREAALRGIELPYARAAAVKRTRALTSPSGSTVAEAICIDQD
ncbi:hypothetical protein CKAH01_05365 [Colletotrichum kahawae]|uniref:Uncharacterized protein n=1 Tax=Colletotrichum kahawae TaxID=34407 RepID=A0AAE0D5I6_COLKA|nr:hypothetical protein CKAH01_05365 [Colletotrichum kahawae]